MAYTIQFNDTNKPALIINNETVDATTSLALIGRDYPDYGENINHNYMHLLENFASTTPPRNSLEGQLWFDTSTKSTQVKTLNGWVRTSGMYITPIPPTIGLVNGDLWQNADTGAISIWHGEDWNLIGGAGTGLELNNTTTSFSTTQAATANVIKTAYDLATIALGLSASATNNTNNKVPKTRTISVPAATQVINTLDQNVTINLRPATTSQTGIVQLTNSIDNTGWDTEDVAVNPADIAAITSKSIGNTIGRMFVNEPWQGNNQPAISLRFNAITKRNVGGIYRPLVAVGSEGPQRILWSKDGLTWEGITAPENNSWTSVYVENDIVAVSSDGINRLMKTHMPEGTPNEQFGKIWMSVLVPAHNWQSIVFGRGDNPKWVAVASNGKSMTSTDANTWTAYDMPSVGWNKVIWSEQHKQFVASAYSLSGSYGIAISPDGETWTPTYNIAAYSSVAWSPELGLYAAISSELNNVIISHDGENWTEYPLDDPFDITSMIFNDIIWCWELGLFIIVGEGNISVLYSADGINWDIANAPDGQWRSIVWSGDHGRFIAVGSSSYGIFMNSI